MKIHKRKRSKILPLLLILAAIAIVLSVVVFMYLHKNKDDTNAKKQTTSFQSDRDQAQQIKDNPGIKQDAPNTDTPSTPKATTPSGKQQVEMTASVNSVDGAIYIRGGINYPVTDGSCYALLHGPSGQSIQKDTTLLSNPASTDCKTITIPTSELSPGSWSFTLYYTSNNYEGSSDEVSFSV